MTDTKMIILGTGTGTGMGISSRISSNGRMVNYIYSDVIEIRDAYSIIKALDLSKGPFHPAKLQKKRGKGKVKRW